MEQIMEPGFKQITHKRLAIYWQERAKMMAENARISYTIGEMENAKLDQADAAIYSANARAYAEGATK